MALVDRIGWSVSTSGLFLILAAVVSEMSGTQANISSHPSPETGAEVRRD